MISEGFFIPDQGKVQESSDVDYIEHESDRDSLSKTLSVTEYLNKIRQHLANII